MRVKCLAQEHNTMTRPGLEPGTLNPESSMLTTRPGGGGGGGLPYKKDGVLVVPFRG